MPINYLAEFPISQDILPPRLRALLEPVGDNPTLRVAISTRWENDMHGPEREYVHMTMAAVPEKEIDHLKVAREASDGVVFYSVPHVQDQAGLYEFSPSISGYDYIVASWGNGSFYSYALAEKVWMSLGLSPRVLGGEQQRIIYDDLSLPEFGVAEGEVATQYYFSAQRDVQWTMSNEYLRRYLWMRGVYGVRVFFYEVLLPEDDSLRALMGGQTHASIEPKDGWFRLDIREFNGGLLVQVWASVAAISPELSPDQSADGLMWPNVRGPMTHERANNILNSFDDVYLDDGFLERYEQNSFYKTTPIIIHGQYHCSPSYLGQWDFTDCVRVGRNLIKTSIRELYKPKPDREIVHAHTFALEADQVATFDFEEEHIVAKTHRLVSQLLDLAYGLSRLGGAIELPIEVDKILKLRREELSKNGWLNYAELSRLAQVAPLSMHEQAFTARCKRIHELWQQIPNGYLRDLVVRAGHTRKDVKDLGSLKLLQALLNVIQRLNANGERVDALGANPDPDDLKAQNTALAALFVNNEFRIADAHETGGVLEGLDRLGFDTASINHGYGHALDHVFNSVIASFTTFNSELQELLDR